MSRTQCIKSQVRRAFNIVGDLAKNVTFIQKSPTSFNFTTAEPAYTTPTSRVVKGILTTKTRRSSKDARSITDYEILIVSDDITDTSIYDTVTIDGSTWKIIFPIRDDSFIKSIGIIREV